MTNQRILLVEDTDAVRLSVTALLKRAGYEVIEARDGESALDILAKEAVDLVVSDVWMPKMDGIALLKTLREQDEKMPVVMISGGSPQAPLEMTAPLAETFGAQAVLYKPFENEELLSAVTTALGAN